MGTWEYYILCQEMRWSLVNSGDVFRGHQRLFAALQQGHCVSNPTAIIARDEYVLKESYSGEEEEEGEGIVK